MPGRMRTRVGSPITGHVKAYGYEYDVSAIPDQAWCQDVTGNREGVNPLWIHKSHMEGCLIKYIDANRSFMDVPSNAYSPWPGLAEPINLDIGAMINRMLSQTGPLTPRVNLPLFMYELKDIPMMLRHAGNLLHGIKEVTNLNPVKEAAAANLAWKFGWEPLIQDIGRLLNFADSVASLQRTLKGAHSKKGVRRKITLDQDSSQTSGNVYGNTDWGLSFLIPYQETRDYTVWGTVRWRVRDPKQYGYEPSFTEAFRNAYGLNLGHIPIAIWKGLPWTWMIDWFADISNILTANYNMISYEPMNLCIMVKTETSRTYKEVQLGSNPTNICTKGKATKIWKTRYANGSPSPQFGLRLPFMDSYKLSVLGSLAILKTSSRR